MIGKGDLDGACVELGVGRAVVVVGGVGEDPVLCLGAAVADAGAVAFAVRYGSGVLRVALPAEDCVRLGFTPMVPAFGANPLRDCVTVDLVAGVTTGISAADRARTVQALADPATEPNALARPGHVIPVATSGTGVIGHAALPEACADLAALAGLGPVAAYCELVSSLDPTRMADESEAADFARARGLACVSVADVLRHRRLRVVPAFAGSEHGTGRVFSASGDGLDTVPMLTVLPKAVGRPAADRWARDERTS